eukprot:2426468-Pyramimonas_sp.AAC.1
MTTAGILYVAASRAVRCVLQWAVCPSWHVACNARPPRAREDPTVSVSQLRIEGGNRRLWRPITRGSQGDHKGVTRGSQGGHKGSQGITGAREKTHVVYDRVDRQLDDLLVEALRGLGLVEGEVLRDWAPASLLRGLDLRNHSFDGFRIQAMCNYLIAWRGCWLRAKCSPLL